MTTRAAAKSASSNTASEESHTESDAFNQTVRAPQNNSSSARSSPVPQRSETVTPPANTIPDSITELESIPAVTVPEIGRAHV